MRTYRFYVLLRNIFGGIGVLCLIASIFKTYLLVPTLAFGFIALYCQAEYERHKPPNT